MASDPRVGAYLADVVAAADDDHIGAVAAVVMRVARARRVQVDLVVDGVVAQASRPVLAVEIDADVMDTAGPWLPGFAREALLSAAERRQDGVHHTDPALASTVCTLAVDLIQDPATAAVLDPAVGGGIFLLAAGDLLPGEPSEIVGRLYGCDIDPLAVGVTRAALTLWSGGTPPPERNLVVGDYLGPGVDFDPMDLILGNPPFLSQLKGETARGEVERGRLSQRWPGVGRYVDTAAAFMLASADGLTIEGVWALIQPDSVLGATDSAAVRERLDHTVPVERIWVDDERRFDAAVDTVALIGRRGRTRISIHRGVPAETLGTVEPPAAKSWSPLLAVARGVPRIGGFRSDGCLGDIADITAGFRDQFYGLREAVVEDTDAPYRLITSGLIDPLTNRWGRTTCRYDKRTWLHPGVVLDHVAPNIRPWVDARLRPKVLVASQTPTIEAIADSDGVLVPCTPVVSVEPHDPADVPRVAALLTCPITTVLLAQASTGTALSSDALRVSASGLAELPLPADRDAWDVAASSNDPVETGLAMQTAYAVDDDALVAWWRKRLKM